MQCQFERDKFDPDLKRCIRCKSEIRVSEPPEKIHQDCILNKEPIGLLEKTVNFTKSVTNHIIQGMPVCEQHQIEARLKICLECDFFVIKKHEPLEAECSKCGCKCSREKKFLNKLAWLDQSCPEGKWSSLVV